MRPLSEAYSRVHQGSQGIEGGGEDWSGQCRRTQISGRSVPSSRLPHHQDLWGKQEQARGLPGGENCQGGSRDCIKNRVYSSVQGLVSGAMSAAQKFVQARLGGKSGEFEVTEEFLAQ